MVCAERPAETIFSISPFNAPFPTSARFMSPRFGNSHLSKACCHPQIVAGFTGLRRRVASDSIHFSAWVRNVVAGAVLVVKDSLLLALKLLRDSRLFSSPACKNAISTRVVFGKNHLRLEAPTETNRGIPCVSWYI